uniref:Ovule protein n=1 Tax=Heterorhabditis bacteriophora TaxID=37862 RepID=A0A1I7WW40_HETBA
MDRRTGCGTQQKNRTSVANRETGHNKVRFHDVIEHHLFITNFLRIACASRQMFNMMHFIVKRPSHQMVYELLLPNE